MKRAPAPIVMSPDAHDIARAMVSRANGRFDEFLLATQQVEVPSTDAGRAIDRTIQELVMAVDDHTTAGASYRSRARLAAADQALLELEWAIRALRKTTAEDAREADQAERQAMCSVIEGRDDLARDRLARHERLAQSAARSGAEADQLEGVATQYRAIIATLRQMVTPT